MRNIIAYIFPYTNKTLLRTLSYSLYTFHDNDTEYNNVSHSHIPTFSFIFSLLGIIINGVVVIVVVGCQYTDVVVIYTDHKHNKNNNNNKNAHNTSSVRFLCYPIP